MPVNASARNYKIQVQIPGGTALDVTAACSGESSGYLVLNESEPDESGVVSVTGKLTLQVSDRYISGNNFPEWSDNGQTGRAVFDPDLNPERWAVGNYVRVEVANDSGVLVSFVRDYLRILKPPNPPYVGNWTLELEIGDDLTLLNWRSPDDDRSGVTIGSLTDRTTIIGNLLAAAGMGNDTNASWAGTVGSYPLRNSLPKTGGGWIDQAGALAFTGNAVLWQNKSQQVLAKSINLNPETAFLTATLGANDIEFVPIGGQEKPCSELQVAGVGYRLQERQDSGSTVSEEWAARSTIQRLNTEGEPQDDGNEAILVKQVFEDWYWDSDGLILTRITQSKEARGIVVPDSFYLDIGIAKQLSPYSVIESETLQEIEFHGSAGTPIEGFKKRTQATRWQLNGAVLADYYRNISAAGRLGGLTNFLSTLESGNSYTTYRYRGTQTREVEATEYGLTAAISATSIDWSDLTFALPLTTDKSLAATNFQQWSEINKGEWKKLDRTRQSGTVQGQSSAAMLSLITTQNQTTISTSGQNQPPAAETKPPKFDRVEVQYLGEALLEPVVGADYAPRKRSYKLDYLTSDVQAQSLAETLADFLQARYRSFQITVAFSDAWLNYEPLSRMDVANGAVTYVGLTSGVTWVLAADQAIVTCTCMKLGTLNTATGEIDRPYRLKLKATAGMGMGASIRILPYSLNLAPIALSAGMGMGGSVSVSPPKFPTITLSAGMGTGAAIQLGDGAAHHWAFEDTSWTDSVGGLVLTNRGSGSVVNATGFIGNSAQFPGTGWLDRRNDSQLSLGGSSWKIKFYLYLSSLATSKTVLAGISTDFSVDEWELMTASGNVLKFDIYNASYAVIASVTSSVVLTTGNWIAVEIEQNLSTNTAYLRVNGIATAAAISGIPAQAGSKAHFMVGGAGVFGGTIHSGTRMDELKIFK